MNVVGIDIDGVLAAQTEYSVDLMRREYNIDVSLSDFSEYTPFFDEIGKDYNEVYNELRTKYDKYHVEIPVFPEAASTVNSIYQSNDVIIITHRPSSVADETLEWLEKHGISFDNIIHDAPKDKSEVRELDVLMDDNPSVLMKSSAETNILFKRPYNTDYTNNQNIDIVVGSKYGQNHWSEINELLSSL